MASAYRLYGTVDTAPPPSRAAFDSERITFWLCVFVTLVFSQCWMMLVTGPGTGGADPSSSAASSQSAALRLVFMPIYVLILGMAAHRPTRFASAMLRSWLLLLLLTIAAASYFWSIQPDITLRRLVAVVATTFCGVLLAERFEWPKTLEVLSYTFGVVVVMSFLFGIVLPRYGVMSIDFPGAWRGVYGFKNQLGYYMSLAVCVFCASSIANPQRRKLWAAAAVGALLLIVLSTSKTALLCSLVGLMCLPFIAIVRRGGAWAVSAIFLAVAGIVLIVGVLALAPEIGFKLVGRDATFTGRTLIWTAVTRQAELQPITGYGYGAVWDDQSGRGPVSWISHDQGFTIFSAHNTMLGVWLELGYLGVTAWFMLLGGAWLKSLSRLFTAPSYFCLPFLFVFTLHGLSEADALVQNDMSWILFSMTVTKLALPFRAREDTEESQAARAVTSFSGSPHPA